VPGPPHLVGREIPVAQDISDARPVLSRRRIRLIEAVVVCGIVGIGGTLLIQAVMSSRDAARASGIL